ncbi:hypothetical protein ACFLXC_04815 [Chloroflexota bacterium]
MMEHCARVKARKEVLLLAHLDGLYGGDNMVDREAISWIQSAVQYRGANVSVLWIDEVAKPHAWRFPPVVKAAIGACDVLINHSFDIVVEELVEFRRFLGGTKLVMVRNFATTAPLLCTKWAQTPQELVNEIRYQASLPVKKGLKLLMTDDNGTHLEGVIDPAGEPKSPWPNTYSLRREEAGAYRPWPEWAHPPIGVGKANGVFVFDCMLSWWPRYMGISPYFTKPVRLDIKDGKITTITGGDEAEALKSFMAMMKQKLGDAVYNFNCLHFGVHPQAKVEPYQCPNTLHRRLIDHSHSSNIHVHIGAPEPDDKYAYWLHMTGDIRTASMWIGDTQMYDKGHLFALDRPAVRAIAAKYPGRPGLEQ